MNFKTRRINKEEPKPSKPILPPNPLKKKNIHMHMGVFGSFIIIILLFIGIAKAIGSIDFKVFLELAGDKLQTDAYNHTNLLILGTGGGDHEGADLTDTIIVASLDKQNKLISMVSIPRDFYIKDDMVGNSKINEIYYNAKQYYGSSAEGLDHMKGKVETMMGIPIHYWIKIDFKGFKELVDAIGGVDINVETAIYDPYYPKDGTFEYETFSISPGQHHMNGETALKYARSRKTTSDFDRADRQQAIIYGLKEKALQTEIIFSKDKISKILETLKENIETNISVKEILTLGAMAGDFSKENITHRLIHDDPTQCGGFLYTPGREFYNNLFVLLPAGGVEFIHQYSDLNFNLPKIAKETTKIQVLNGTKNGGVAGETKQILQRFCFDITRFGNGRSKDIAETTYYYQAGPEGENSRPEALDFIEKLIPGKESTQIPQEYLDAGYLQNSNLIIELGADYVNSGKYMNDPFYSLPQLATPTLATPTPATPTPATPEAPATTEAPTETNNENQ